MLALRQFRKNVESGAFVFFREHDVKADSPDVVLVEQIVDDLRQHIARPRPAPNVGKAAFVDIQNDDFLVDRIGQGQLQTKVVREIFQPVDERNGNFAGGVEHEHRNDRDTEADTNNSLKLQIESLRRGQSLWFRDSTLVCRANLLFLLDFAVEKSVE